MKKLDEVVTVNDEQMTREEFKEMKSDLPENERLVEVDKDKFRKLERMNG